MADGSRRSPRRFALAVLAGLGAGALSLAPALAQQPSAADVQWAQMFLKDKGFNIGGRANGQMTPETRAAISQYQKSVGLPATGNLDQATVGKIMGERNAKTSNLQGNLAQQRPGGGGPGQAPREPQREVVPRAAKGPGGVESNGGDGVAMLGPVVRQGPVDSAAPGAAAPQAVPRGSVTATTSDGREVSAHALSKGEDEAGFTMPGWVRYAVMVVIGGTLSVLGLAWWRSGRPAAEKAPIRAPSPGETRREPSLAPRRDDLTTGPRLTADRRR